MRRLPVTLLALLFLLAPSGAFGQTAQATLTGRVLDSSKAVVPNVTVEVINLETNRSVRAATDGTGNYTASFLRPGTYALSAEAAGFKKFTRSGLVLGVGQVMTIDAVLEVGSQTEQVTVTSETPLLETANADRGGTIDQSRVLELPINGRNPFMLSRMVAGVSFIGVAQWIRPFDNGAIADWQVNGSPSRSTDFLLDGAPNNSGAGSNDIAYVPPVDAVQEFKIQTNSYDAQYGHNGGGVVNVSLKSGTNEFHGTGYEFLRRQQLDANSFQNNAAGVTKDAHYLDQYGSQFQGPILLPKLYNGRNRSFFMVNYERYREGTPRPFTVSVPEPEMATGDFSKLADGDGNPIVIYDPSTGRDVKGVWTRDPFPSNKIPGNRINPIAQKLMGYFPKPNQSLPGEAYASNNLYFSGPDAVDRDSFYNLAVKLDHNFSDRHRVYFRLARNDRREFGHDDENAVIGIGESGALPEQRTNNAYALDWTSTLSPRAVLNWRGSFARYSYDHRGDGNKGFDLTKLGFPTSLVSQIPGGAYFGTYSFSDYQGLGQYPSGDITNTLSGALTLSVNWRGHTTKVGIDARWVQWSNQSLGNPLNLSFDGAWTQQAYNRSDGLSGNSAATALLGYVSSGSSAFNAIPIYLYKYNAPWIQDDWRVSRKLTINLGFRWDFNMPATERYNRMNAGFDSNVVNPVDKMIDRTAFPNLKTLRGELLFAGVNGMPRAAADTYKRALQPRFGFAYQVANKLVVRGGWGRSYINPTNAYLQTIGFNASTPLISTNDGGRTPIANLLNNPFTTINLPPGSSQGALTYLGQGISFVNPQFRLPYVNQFSFGIQTELLPGLKVEATYVGSRGKDLQSTLGINNYDMNFRRQCNLAEGGTPLPCDALQPNPFQGLAPFNGTSRFTASGLSLATMATPYPHFGSLTNNTRNDNASWFNSLQLNFETRRKKGVNLLATYVYSKNMTQSGWMDELKLIPQRSLATRDTPHRITVTSVWELPFGSGKRFLKSSHGLVSRLVSGWENSLMFVYQSGTPWGLPGALRVHDATLPEIDWSATRVRAITTCVAQWNDNGSITMLSYSVQQGCKDYDWLIMPRYGPTRYNTINDGRVRLHTAPQLDMSLNKTTAITEKVRLQFRAEAFNLTNTFMFNRAGFSTTQTSVNFGTLVPSTTAFTNTNAPRYIQLGFKLLW